MMTKHLSLALGWGALSMLRKLRADHYNVTIVSPRNYFLFTPLLPSTTTGTINIQAIIEPIRDYCRRANAGHAVYVGYILCIYTHTHVYIYVCIYRSYIWECPTTAA